MLAWRPHRKKQAQAPQCLPWQEDKEENSGGLSMEEYTGKRQQGTQTPLSSS